MPILIEQDWRSYIRNGDETTAELLSGDSPVIATLDAFDGFFRKRLWTGEDDLSPSQMLLALHSYMVLLAGVRLALTGHAAATFPLFRTALEAACYALLMKTDKEYETAWLERDQSPAKTKACRVMFTSAVAGEGQAEGSWQGRARTPHPDRCAVHPLPQGERVRRRATSIALPHKGGGDD